MASLRAVLVQNRDFRRLVIASVVSLAGDWFSFVAVASLVTELTGHAGAPAYVYAATVLPVFLASPFAGVIADRFDRRKTLVVVDLLRVPVALALCLAHSVPVAVAMTALLAVGASFSDPITSAATPNLVPKEHLATAQALMGAIWGSMLLVGAGIGGVVAEMFGRNAAFIVDAASFAISAWSIAGIEAPMQVERSPDGSLREAFAFIWRSPRLLRLVFAKGGVSVANGIVGLIPVFAARRYASHVATGLLLSARGLGAMLGPLVVRYLVGATPGRRAVVLVCGISCLTYAASYGGFVAASSFVVAMILVASAHLGGGAQWALSTYGLQVETPDAVRGRVMAIDYGLATLAIGASGIVAGVLADHIGIVATTEWLCLVGAAYGILWTLWSI